MRKITVLVAAVFFIAGLLPAVAEEGSSKSGMGKSIFQIAREDISEIGKSGLRQKVNLADMFQASKDYIIESSPRAKKLSLRGRAGEIEKRRGTPLERKGGIELETRQ